MVGFDAVQVAVPAGLVPRLMAFEVGDGRSAMVIGSERSAHAAFWGPQSRRFRAFWTWGRWTGSGYVEVRPSSSWGSQLVVCLDVPPGLAARGAWPASRLKGAAFAFARRLRSGIELAATRELPAATARGA